MTFHHPAAVKDRNWRHVLWAGLFLVGLSGCGGEKIELLNVEGVVTMDGQPLPEAEIQFLPIVKGTEGARPSSGMTDADGHYELRYSRDDDGARPGMYRVTISTKRSALPEIPARPETVPKKYNIDTTLTAEVSREQRVFNFDLDSKSK